MKGGKRVSHYENTAKLTLENTFRISQRMLNSLQLLQMDRLALESHISEQLMENPVLEFPGIDSGRKVAGKENGREGRGMAGLGQKNQFEALEFFLLDQLNRMMISGKTMGLCKALVKLIDENGYLPAGHIPDSYLQSRDYTQAVQILQTLEPAGVAARNVRECLLLQLQRKDMEDSLAAALVENYLEDVSRRNLSKLQRMTGASMEDLQRAIRTIVSLNPKPGAAFENDHHIGYVYPDFLVSVQGDIIRIAQEDRSFPVLKVSDYYVKLYHTTGDPEVKQYLKNRIAAAKHLIAGLENRKTTSLRCLEAVIQVQRGFFLNPSRQLVPLTLESVARKVDLHISTVSRAVSGKYLEFDGKTYPLRYFFARGTQNVGETVATSQIRELIRQIVKNEAADAPMSDQQIVQVLQQGGIRISRRTVAKYREQMGILPSKQRRIL